MERREFKTYSEAEINQRLQQELPKWYFEDGWIRRKFKTEGWKGTLMVVNTIGHLAEAAWHHPDLTVSYAFVIVKLQSHDAKGITDRDFELARQIEAVVQWRTCRRCKCHSRSVTCSMRPQGRQGVRAAAERRRRNRRV